ncbi:hypothetical protein FGE12_26205 [Aggregicoccus sp. 17bor-14]|uniref:hypothetical protein n=1 Tax=Myxococcaceae TaxID=31 RepID=UPI00129CC0C7|nr:MULTISPECIES: hypothetical protein [Myxococcaceae]MBF5045931.1 hypothetical protein [Simulacricoccus sp. 17bor-14]MRI91664.1 hypothetical protein [Aggregicoccus sp. 17bor-14]
MAPYQVRAGSAASGRPAEPSTAAPGDCARLLRRTVLHATPQPCLPSGALLHRLVETVELQGATTAREYVTRTYDFTLGALSESRHARMQAALVAHARAARVHR